MVKKGLMFRSKYPNKTGNYHFQLSLGEMLVISYSGLRGAIAYAMSKTLLETKDPSIDDEMLRANDIFLSTTLIIILLTCFLQGGTVRFLVKFFHFEVRKPTSRYQHDSSCATSLILFSVGNYYHQILTLFIVTVIKSY